MILEHKLGEETLTLLNRVVTATKLKLVIYKSNMWGLENDKDPGRLTFDPRHDSEWLRNCLRTALERGRV